MVKMSLALIVLVSIVGLAFSGYLSYYELSGQGQSCTLIQRLFGLPACVIGFVMYLIILILALLPISKNPENPAPAPVVTKPEKPAEAPVSV